MEKGIVFDIQELCVHDGPGPRTTVFMKGCTMRCKWCHNPEGWHRALELMRTAGCLKCGRCEDAEALLRCGKVQEAVRLCKNGCLRVAGCETDAEELAGELLRYKDSFKAMGGGVTVSGGECLLQSRFVAELLYKLRGIHRAIETAGDAESEDFVRVLPHVELVLFDIKLMDDELHKKWTGVGNTKILKNLDLVAASGVPFCVRIPLIPGVNDSLENLEATALRVRGLKSLVCVELLPYNTNAGAKYAMLDREYSPDPLWDSPPQIECSNVFKDYGIPCRIVS